MRQFLLSIRRVTLLPTLSFIFAFFIGGIIIVISDPIIMSQLNSPGKFLTSAAARIGNSYLAIFQGSIYDVNLARESGVVRGFYPLSETIVTSIPLIFAGLAVALAFRSGLFNIGAQGQFIFGAIGASYVGFNFELPPLIHVPLGADLRLHLGVFIALAVTYFVWWLLNRSTLGYKFRAVGANASAAKTAGISVPLVTTVTMFICGGLAGLGGAVHLIGTEYALTAGVAGSIGFDAITVALLGQATPIGTLFGALLFGALQTGGRTLLSNTGTSSEIIQVIQALIVLFIAAPALLKRVFRLKKSVESKSMAAKGWNG